MLDNSSAVVDCNDGGLNKVSLGWKVGTLIPCASAIQDLRGTEAESGSEDAFVSVNHDLRT